MRSGEFFGVQDGKQELGNATLTATTYTRVGGGIRMTNPDFAIYGLRCAYSGAGGRKNGYFTYGPAPQCSPHES